MNFVNYWEYGFTPKIRWGVRLEPASIKRGFYYQLSKDIQIT